MMMTDPHTSAAQGGETRLPGTRHADAVMHMLSARARPRPAQVCTPFGVELTATNGRFEPGEWVLAPGLDECTPMSLSEVVAVGTRRDQPGTWCLLVDVKLGTCSALIREDGLRRVGARAN
jgi:hypothetical protein